MQVVEITDPADERLADYRLLNDVALRRRIEAGGGPHGIFIAEGITVVSRLLASPLPLRSLLVLPQRLERILPLADACAAPVFVAPRAVLAAVAGFDLHRGVLAAADRPAPLDPWALAASARTLAVLEGVNDHENLGAIARSAAALGVDGLLLDPTCCDPWYRRSLRVSMGALLTLSHARLTPWPGGLTRLAGEGWRLLALTPDPAATPIGEIHRTGDDRVALLLGAEGPGLSAAARAAAEPVRIPLAARDSVDSLNVGHAAAIAFHRLGLVTDQ